MTANAYDAIVIGAGHNGLVAGAYLARTGRRVLVVERRDRVGGILSDSPLGPGLRVPLLAHTVGRLRRSVIRDLSLESHGLRLIRPAVRAFAPQPDGSAVTLWSDPQRTARELHSLSPHDAAAYPLFDRKVRVISSFLALLNASAPPDVQVPSLSDAVAGLRLGRAFRRLGPRAGRETLRVLPMPVADWVGEHFELDSLQGAIAARAVQFTAMGPWTAGTAAVLLADSAGNDGGAAGQTVFASGGPGILAEALAGAARALGVQIRTGAEAAAVTIAGGRATGVALATGEEITAPVVVSAADPKRTLLQLVDPEELGPTLVWRASNIRTPGCTAKVNLALSGVPSFVGAEGDERLRGRIVIAPGIDYLERGADAAKYRRTSQEPYLEATIPSLVDPSLAPEGEHVMSIVAQWAPYRLRESNWDVEKDGLGDLVVKTLEGYAPGLSSLITARQVLTPVDLETDLGLTGGHVLHGEPGLDQFFAWRPLLGFARYRMPLAGLYLCGSGAHPGGGVTGAPGANAAREILRDWKRARRPSPDR
jgi:phytoene dehydrogenase-like protein